MKYKIVEPPADPMELDTQSELETESPDVDNPITLTRYLYIKEEVLVSLALSIFEKKKEEALFWAYELYYSGFQDLVMEYVNSIYNEMFKAHNPKLGKFISARIAEWREDNSKANCLGTIVVNLCDPVRKFNVDGFITRNFPPPSKTPDIAFYVMFDDASKYDQLTGVIPRKVLERACLYSSRKNGNEVFGCTHAELPADQLKGSLFYNWLYYASFSPIWNERISKHRGIVCHETKTVNFDDLEEFYDIYGYEPDEQSANVISKLTHLDAQPEQMTKDEFIEIYNALGKK
jgi:hypothetical protein